MPLDFRSPSSKHRSRPKPSPYGSGGNVQRRFLMLAGLLVLVLVLMQQAQKAENFHWLWYLQGQPIPDGQDAAKVDTRVRDRDARGGSASEFGPLVTGIRSEAERQSVTTSQPFAQPSLDDTLADDSPLQRARTDAWSGLLEAMESDIRRQFLTGLKSARDEVPLDETDRPQWSALVAGLDEGWQQYLSEARRSIEQAAQELNDDERQQWLAVLAELEEQWQQQSLPALAALAEPEPPLPEHQQALERIQAELDAVFLSAIRDNTVFRPTEMDAWFRLLERLSRSGSVELQSASAGTVGFGQLFKQPDVYRGRLVTVQGTVRRAEFKVAPDNLYGIDGYYMLWLQPVSANSPIVIYSLEIPDRFPANRAAKAGGSQVDLDEDIVVTGYFFKRWAYPAQDGTRLAPVILARSLRGRLAPLRWPIPEICLARCFGSLCSPVPGCLGSPSRPWSTGSAAVRRRLLCGTG
jgi:hypothetical protein